MGKSMIVMVLLLAMGWGQAGAQALPDRSQTLETLVKVNGYFMRKWPDPATPTVVKGITRSSNLWTRAVYYEGLMALYDIHPQEAYYQYMYDWGEAHRWAPRRGMGTRNADDYCCSQLYIDMYRLAHEPRMIQNVIANMDMLVSTPEADDWWWVDALQMGMPVLAKLGVTTGERKYFDKMWDMYAYTRNRHGMNGLYNTTEHLWWRDRDFVPPYREPNGRNCYWSRGNGWVYAALARVLDEIPADEPHRDGYIDDFLAMSEALKACQRSDGFWNVSLHDETHFGGKETTGTALFVYGMAWGVRRGLLDRDEYLPVLVKAWNAMVADAVHEDGMLGYVQGTGKEPKDGQPVTYDTVPDFEDFGIGCFLLAGTEVYKLK
ncbi:MAG: glycoside hydrolase family 88 protein [Prevotellaceae bacterium]|nr:glycoside hydrolase family 88 protein [Prevotellaceae bacterium]